MDTKLIFVDVETTGRTPWKHAIHKLSGSIVNQTTGTRETFSYKLRPHKGALIDDEALAVSNTTKLELEDFPDSKEAYDAFVKLLGKHVNKFDKKDKLFMIGYNVSFDSDFLRAFFKNQGDKFYGSWFWSNTIDVMTLAGQRLMDKRAEMVDFKLGTVAMELGINLEGNLHDADEDIRVTEEMYYKLINRRFPVKPGTQMGIPLAEMDLVDPRKVDEPTLPSNHDPDDEDETPW